MSEQPQRYCRFYSLTEARIVIRPDESFIANPGEWFDMETADVYTARPPAVKACQDRLGSERPICLLDPGRCVIDNK